MTYDLPEPFFVIATQNPQHAVGTFPLPESQLDRFLMRIELGVPDRTSERAMLLGMDRRDMLKELKPVMSRRTLIEIQDKCETCTLHRRYSIICRTCWMRLDNAMSRGYPRGLGWHCSTRRRPGP